MEAESWYTVTEREVQANSRDLFRASLAEINLGLSALREHQNSSIATSTSTITTTTTTTVTTINPKDPRAADVQHSVTISANPTPQNPPTMNISIPNSLRRLIQNNPFSGHQATVQEELRDEELRRRRRTFMTEEGEWKHESDRNALREVEVLHSAMMTLPPGEHIPHEEESNVLHTLAMFGKLRMEAMETAEILAKLKEDNEKQREEFAALTEQWEEREQQWRDEVKRMEKFVATETEKGLEAVVLARQASLVDRGSRKDVKLFGLVRQVTGKEDEDDEELDEIAEHKDESDHPHPTREDEPGGSSGKGKGKARESQAVAPSAGVDQRGVNRAGNRFSFLPGPDKIDTRRVSGSGPSVQTDPPATNADNI